MSTDSVRQFWDLYAYGQTPINGIDPDGREFRRGILGDAALMANTRYVVNSGLSYAQPYNRRWLGMIPRGPHIYMNRTSKLTRSALGRAEIQRGIDGQVMYGSIYIASHENLSAQLGNDLAEQALIAWEIGNAYGVLQESVSGVKADLMGLGRDYIEAYLSMNEFLSSQGSEFRIGYNPGTEAPQLYNINNDLPVGMETF